MYSGECRHLYRLKFIISRLGILIEEMARERTARSNLLRFYAQLNFAGWTTATILPTAPPLVLCCFLILSSFYTDGFIIVFQFNEFRTTRSWSFTKRYRITPVWRLVFPFLLRLWVSLFQYNRSSDLYSKKKIFHLEFIRLKVTTAIISS